jgi:hypothetical protein
MPVEFISATHTTPSTEATGAGRHFGFDVDYTRRFVRYLDDGGFDWTLVAMRPDGRIRASGSPSGRSSPRPTTWPGTRRTS